MPNFAQATPSVGALTTGLALEIERLDSQLQQDGFKLLETGVQTEGAASSGLANAISSAMNQQADSAEFTAYSNMANAGFMAVGEGIGIGRGLVYNKQISAAEEAEGRLTEADTKIHEIESEPRDQAAQNQQASIVATNQETDKQITDTTQRLRRLDFSKERVTEEDNENDLRAAQKGNPKAFEEAKAEVQRKLKIARKRVSNLNGEKDSMKQKITQWSRIVGEGSQAGLQYQAAAKTRDQAGEEALRQQAQYALDTVSRANNTTGETIKNWASNQKDAVRALQEGIAQANRV